MGGSLFPADHSGVLGVLGSLTALVLFGVTISLLLDGGEGDPGSGSSFASSSADLNAKVVGLETDLKHLKGVREGRMERAVVQERLDARQRELAALTGEIDDLSRTAAEEKVRVEQVREEFARYRIDYRKRLWSDSIGRRFPEIRMADGKAYRDVIIRSISALRLKISHASGSATLEIADLPRELLEEYHLSHEEARDILEAIQIAEAERLAEVARVREAERARELASAKKKRRARSKSPTRLPGNSSRPEPSREKNDPKRDAEVASLQLETATLHGKLTTLRGEIAEARQKAAWGKQRSPAGSLETWGQRASRLSGIEGRMNSQLWVVENRLRALGVPGDP